MWLLTRIGFFSVVRKSGDVSDEMLTIRARLRADLENFRDLYLPGMAGIFESRTNDYRFRARVLQSDFATALGKIALDIDYDNFKNAVAKEQGAKRAGLYHDVWDVLYSLQSDASYGERARTGKSNPIAQARIPTADAYGGILLNDRGQVLLREPLNHFGGYVWTFPKGKPDRGEAPHETALREVFEEAGCRAEIIAPMKKAYSGSSRSTTSFFLMRSLESQGKPDNETEATRWVSFAEAPAYIRQTSTEGGRKRDLQVLADAESLCRELGLST